MRDHAKPRAFELTDGLALACQKEREWPRGPGRRSGTRGGLRRFLTKRTISVTFCKEPCRTGETILVRYDRFGDFQQETTRMRAEEYTEGLAADGRYHFTTEDAVGALGGSDASVRKQLRRLKQHGSVASPMRSFHVLVPPEYRRLGCPPAEHFIDQLMDHLGEPYYVALLSAAARHGAAHQRPQSLQVMVRRNRAAIECGQVRIAFIARGDLERMPIATVNTPRGYVRYSTPEVTAFELVGYPKQAAGLSNVATVLGELAEAIDKDKLIEVAKRSPIGWSQRLGYLLELVEQADLANALAPYVEEHARSYTPLRRAEDVAGATRSPRWKLIINTEVEPDE